MKTTSSSTVATEHRYVRQAELLTIVPFSAATLWRKVKSGGFVAPVKLSERITAWERAKVVSWLESKGAPR